MTKQLFEEALADINRVKQVAEDNAKRTVIDAVTPRIRDFIERALLQEQPTPIDAMPGMPGASDVGAIEAVAGIEPASTPVAAAITPPDAEGKVTLDIDALCGDAQPLVPPGPGMPVEPPVFGGVPIEDEYEISLESIDALRSVAGKVNKRLISPTNFRLLINKVVEHVNLMAQAGPAVRSTTAYKEQIKLMIARVENIYDYVQEQVAGPRKTSYETILENSFTALNTLQESTSMSHKTNKKRVNEADLTLKLTGLPDEVEDMLDGVGVDLITGEEGDDGLEGEEGGEEGNDAGLDDLDFDGGDEQGTEDEDTQMENRKLSDDTIVEIDEKMLRREIARMRSLREETKPAAWGDGPGGANILDDFGGGKDEGDAVDQTLASLSPAKGARPLGENDEEDLDEQDQDDLDEQDQDDLDEQDQDLDQAVHGPQDMAMTEDDQDLDQGYMDQAIDGPAHGGDETVPTNKQSRHPGESYAEARRSGLKRLAFEQKLQERAKSRAASLKKEAAAARSKKNAKRFNECKKEYSVVAQRFNESLARSKKLTLQVAKATKKLQEARSNSVATRPADGKAELTLRKKLAETNLINAKLLLTNKLITNSDLTHGQKTQAIKQLSEVHTVGEAKVVFESVIKTVNASRSTIREGADRKVLGSASRATRPASTNLNEGIETERWARLAGITK